MKTKLIKISMLFMVFAISIQLQAQGTALNFDGTNDYVNCGNASSLNITGSITIEAWINADTWNANSWGGTIVSKDNTNQTGYALRCGNNGMLSFVIGAGGAWHEVLSGSIMSSGRWNYVVGVYDGATMSIYVNGVLAGQQSLTGSIGVSALSMFIGNSPGYPTRFFDGKIDEVRIFNVARTQAQIQSDMCNTLTGTETGLVNYWQFNNGSGTTLTDVVGSSTGTLTNMDAATCWVESYAMVVPAPAAATNILSTGFTANWTAPAIGTVTSYKLDVSTNNTFTAMVSGYNNADCGSGLSKAVTGLTNGTTYYYRVRADKTSVTGAGANYYTYITATPCASATISSQSTPTQSQPLNGTFTAITVTATGDNLTYQWYSNANATNSGGTSLGANNGAQTYSYTPQATTIGTLYYYCVVSSTCGAAQTSAVSGAIIVNTLVAGINGTGTTSDPYQITSLSDLQWLQTQGNYQYWQFNFIQTADINAVSCKNWNGGTGFSPIGYLDGLNSIYYKFTGTYNGKGHSVDSIYINRLNSNMGFFGYLKNATIDSLSVTNVSIRGNGTCGGLAGYAVGNTTISYCNSSGSITGNNGYSLNFGGLVGNVNGEGGPLVLLKYCYSSAKVSHEGSNYENLGGLVGINSGRILQCYSTGLVITDPVKLIFNSGGGFLGRQANGFSDSSYWDIETSGQTTGGKATDTTQVHGRSTTLMKNQTTYAGWDFTNRWFISPNVNDGYPCFYYPLSKVSTQAVTNIANYSAIAHGKIERKGTLNITSYGVCYNTNGTPIVTDSKVNLGITNINCAFSANLTSLHHGTIYYLRAYAINERDTVYGEQVSFTTTNVTQASTCLFNGDQFNYISIPNNSSLQLTNNYSIEVWLKPGVAVSTNRIIVSKGFNANGYTLLSNGSGNQRGLIFDGMATADNILTQNQWCHVAAVNDNGTRHLYLNGVEMPLTGTPTSVTANTQPLYLSNYDNGGSSNVFRGYIEEVRLWNTAMTYSQIRENMHLPLTGSETGLVSYWQFDEGQPTTVYDKKGVNNGIWFFSGINPYKTSTIPFGSGNSNTQVVSATGTTTFTNTGLAMNFTAKTGLDSIVVAVIDTFPNLNPTGFDTILDKQYWAVHKYGTGTFTANLTFTISEDLTAYDQNNPSKIKLYTRSGMADDASWVELAIATSVNAEARQVTFNNISSFSQFIVARAIDCVNPTSAGTIAGDQTGCTPFEPVVFTSTVAPSGQIGALEYKWQQSTTSSSVGFSDIPNSNFSTYNPGLLTDTTWYKRLVHVVCKTDWTGAATSNVITITVNPTTSISSQSTATQTQTIHGTFTPITVTAIGSGLLYQWYKNTTATNSGGTSLGANNGAQTNSYTPQATTLGPLYYYCIVTGTCGTPKTSAVSGVFQVNPYVGKYSGGTGTSGDPYQIANLDDLIELSDSVADWNTGKYFFQIADIDATSTNTLNSGAGFFPIGSYDFDFNGVYDGQNHTITNLYINRSSTEVGLFGYILGSGDKVKNLGLINVNITGGTHVGGLAGYLTSYSTISNCYSTGSVSGVDRVGGLVGSGNGYCNIDNCYSTTGVSGHSMVGGLVGHFTNGSTLSNSHSTGNVNGNNSVGGLVGYSYGTVSKCYATGSVTGSLQTVGGLVGVNCRTISKCYATGSVTGSGSCNYVGGLVGSNEGWEVNNSSATGSVSGHDNVGGLFGVNAGTVVNNCYATGSVSGSGSNIGGLNGSNQDGGEISNSYSTGSVSGSGTNIGGLNGNDDGWSPVNNCFWDTQTSGQSTSFGGTGLTTAQMKTQSPFTTSPSNWDFTPSSGIWKIESCSYISYPYLQAFTYDIPEASPAVNPIPGLVQVNNNYNISVSVNPANSGIATGTGIYCLGNIVTLTATENTGYSFVNWTENGTPVSVLASYQFTSTENRTLVANFAINTFTLDYTVDANGSITGDLNQTVNYGANGTEVEAIPNTGYHFVNWSDASTQNPRTDLNVTANIDVIANFAINTYTLDYVTGTNGSITGTASQTVNYGANGTEVEAIPNTGYHFVNWSDASTTNPRTDLNVTGNIDVTTNFAINTYTLDYTAGANGSITGTANQTVNYNASGTSVEAIPNTGYHFVNWSDASTTNPRTDLNVTGNIDVTANFAINTFTLDYTADANGTITGDLNQTVNYGADGNEVTAVPNTGYHFVDWSDASTTNPRTDLNVTANNAVTANFAINTYTLAYTAGTNGTITGTTSQTVNYGADGSEVTAVPNTGYHFVDWSDANTANPRTDLNVTANIAVTANYAINTYTLDYTAGTNGSITGDLNQTVNYNENGTEVTAVANANYHFVDWSDASTTNPRTDLNVTGNINVTATFAINTYTLDYTAGANGSISGTASQTVNYNANGTAVTAVPNTGYHFVNWSDASTTNPRTDLNVTANINVTANFAINTYTLDYAAGTNGSITGTANQTVNYGANGSQVTAVPSTGYHFVDWSDASTTNPRTDANVTANVNVTANFAINTYTLDYNAGANGSITGIANQTVNYNANGTAVTAVPSTGCHFVDWSDASTTNPRTDLNVTANIAVTANFAINTFTLDYTAGANGTITGTANQTVNYGANGTQVTAVANAGYHFVDWSDASTTNPRTDLNVTSNITLTANFSINTFTLDYTAGANGSISGTASQTVNYNANGTAVTAIPNTGYHFVNWSDASTTNPRTDLNVTANVNVTANFAINTYLISASVSPVSTGTITGDGNYNYGDNVSLIATPNTGYTFVNWTESGTQVSTNATFAFTASADRTLVANFELSTGIETSIQSNSISVYPNPSTGLFNIVMPSNSTSDAKIMVYDATGKQVVSALMNSTNYLLDLSKYADGVYSMVIKTDIMYISKRLFLIYNY